MAENEALVELKHTIKEIKYLLTGNGEPQKGLCFRLAMIEQYNKERIDPTLNEISQFIQSYIKRPDDSDGNPKERRENVNDISWGKVKTTVIGWLSIMFLSGIGILIYQWLQTV